ncbi:PREDICTED: deoxynucleotidyltransferase terminal-interacting protein 1-like [Priapulus caudatus]|uniref:Deoxynucleotidyltransferase terminal-interacting protein 1-like n=1 Tax=Priapulus caudatus TaxID=37621 RepID=A0ABM1EUQ1_PRICU|nr:PREDICTED: deoxynucleotidyltransferase terminal-interacting protein 1-like [Priapulus caudatus]
MMAPADRLPRLLPENVALPSGPQQEGEEEQEDIVQLVNPFNMRLNTLNCFPSSAMTNRTNSRTHLMALHRAKIGSITSAAKTLDLLRQNLQNSISQEIDAVLQKYLDKYFSPCFANIKKNNGDDAVSEDHIQTVCRQVLEEAKKLYSSPTRSSTPVADVSDTESITGFRMQRLINKNIPGYLKRGAGHVSDTDSDASQPVNRYKRKGKFPFNSSGRSTPSKMSKSVEVVKREAPTWDSERLTPDTLFVMGAKANKSLGLGATRGRVYIKHPELFKYSGDADDKVWLCEQKLMPATGGKAYLLIEQDIRDLAETNEYRSQPGLMLDILRGFTIPERMLVKIKLYMEAMRTDSDSVTKVPSSSRLPFEKFLAKMEPSEAGEEDEMSSEAGRGTPSKMEARSSGATSPGDNLSSESHNPSPLGPFADLDTACHVSSALLSSGSLMLDDHGPMTGPFDIS